MNLIHDSIKIKYVREGYLPNWPYHLIADSEMFDAFLHVDADGNLKGYFSDTYPLVNKKLEQVYQKLVEQILYHIDEAKKSKSSKLTLPNWIYSYMLGNVIGPDSEIADIHDLLVMLGTDNLYDVFDEASSEACYDISKVWCGKLPAQELEHRPPTVFGEPHVIKYLRLMSSAQLSAVNYQHA